MRLVFKICAQLRAWNYMQIFPSFSQQTNVQSAVLKSRMLLKQLALTTSWTSSFLWCCNEAVSPSGMLALLCYAVLGFPLKARWPWLSPRSAGLMRATAGDAVFDLSPDLSSVLMQYLRWGAARLTSWESQQGPRGNRGEQRGVFEPGLCFFFKDQMIN